MGAQGMNLGGCRGRKIAANIIPSLPLEEFYNLTQPVYCVMRINETPQDIGREPIGCCSLHRRTAQILFQLRMAAFTPPPSAPWIPPPMAAAVPVDPPHPPPIDTGLLSGQIHKHKYLAKLSPKSDSLHSHLSKMFY